MKAISLWQPWASAIAVGCKSCETRHWKTAYRGPIAIHAAQTSSRELEATFDRFMSSGGNFLQPHHRARLFSFTMLPKGAVVAIAELREILTTEQALKECCISTLEMMLGNYGPDRFVWFLGNVKPLREPYFIKGHQGIFNVPDSIGEMV